MSNVDYNSNNNSFLREFGTSLGFGALLTGGFGSLSSIRRNKGITKAIHQTHLNNEVINEFLKKNTSGDIFTRNLAAARNYEEYSSLLKSAQRAQKACAKIAKKGAPTIWQRIKNLGKSDDVIISKYKKLNESATNALNTATKKLKSGEEILETTLENGKVKGTNILKSGLKTNVKSLFKQELLNPMNILYAVTSTYSRIKEEAVPVFKEQGIGAGIKQTFISIGKSAADIVSNAGFSAVFRMIGSTVGKFAGPVGSAIGGTIGDIFGTFLSNKFISGILGDNKKKEAAAQIESSEEVVTENNVQTNNATAPLSHLEGKALLDYADSVQAKANQYKIKRFA